MAKRKEDSTVLVIALALGAGALLFWGSRASAAPGGAKEKKAREMTAGQRISGLGPDFAEPPEDVVLLKELLGAWGYDPGTYNGVWTVQTSNALKAFQKDHNLETSGEVDGITANLLVDSSERSRERLAGLAGVL